MQKKGIRRYILLIIATLINKAVIQMAKSFKTIEKRGVTITRMYTSHTSEPGDPGQWEALLQFICCGSRNGN